ncbi:MAG TPA: DUF2203 family protein [Planctomycetota bacterium]|nr:DUF2203 family protein [Planctomycetota bacterium]
METTMKHDGKTERKNLAEAKALIPILRSIANEVRERRLRLARYAAMMRLMRQSPSSEGFVSSLEDLESAIRAENRGLESALSEIDKLGLSVQSTGPFVVHIPGRTPGGDVIFSWEDNQAGALLREEEEVADRSNSNETV